MSDKKKTKTTKKKDTKKLRVYTINTQNGTLKVKAKNNNEAIEKLQKKEQKSKGNK